MRKLLMIASFLVCLGSLAEAADYYPAFVPQPGSVAARNKTWVFDVARQWAAIGPALYYRAYGEWPADWATLRSSGIVTVQLRSIHGTAIDPDDRRLDFGGDVQYMFKGPQQAPLIASLSENGRVRYDRLGSGGNPQTYAERWQVPPANYPGSLWQASGFKQLGQDSARYQQMAVQRAYHAAVELYAMLHGGFCDWATLQVSGLGPHAPGTLNPLTGQVWRGDGSPNDLLFMFSPERPLDGHSWIQTSDGSCFICLITDESGNTPWDFR